MLSRVRAPAGVSLLLGLLLALAGCGASGHPGDSGPLAAFNLPEAGTNAAADAHSWHQYGGRPVDRELTINPVTVYDAGRTPLTLVGLHQLHPAPGLAFGTAMVTLTPGFAGFSEYVNDGAPTGAFGLRANFSPLAGFVVDPDPTKVMTGVSPSLVLTVRATRPGTFHIGDWVVVYRVGGVQHTLTLADDGTFCAGASGCPGL